MPSRFAFQFYFNPLIRQVKVGSPEESGCIVTHENVPDFSNRNYERRSSKFADENAKC